MEVTIEPPVALQLMVPVAAGRGSEPLRMGSQALVTGTVVVAFSSPWRG